MADLTDGESNTEWATAADGYRISIRRFTSEEPKASILMLHGVVSHSEWLAPLARPLADLGYDVICPDRRGAGLNAEAPGDAPDLQTLVDDVEMLVERVCQSGLPVHLCGFCWGASYAIHCVERLQERLDSLLLLAPSVFPAADLAGAELVVGPSPEPTEIPIVPIDLFTSGPAFKEYIEPDPLRTRVVSPRFNGIMAQATSMLAIRWQRLKLPTLVVLPRDDGISDTGKHISAFERLRATPKELVVVPGWHGLQFDAPKETIEAITHWLTGNPSQTKE